ncbi:hypothetical protein [Massilia genomosp. 1]|uniref:hypothetical protein n=1 Tax=Massilia genomosp. 1 TaxID=2609280 RepID=UPI001E28A9B9|nr:hypothetical protein [Massilia genomosp. 1]
MSTLTTVARGAVVTLVAAMLSWAVATPAVAEEFATRPEAEAMVKKTIVFMKANGKDKTYSEINRKDGPFTERDLYMVAYGVDGVVVRAWRPSEHAEQESDGVKGYRRQGVRERTGRDGQKESFFLARI